MVGRHKALVVEESSASIVVVLNKRLGIANGGVVGKAARAQAAVDCGARGLGENASSPTEDVAHVMRSARCRMLDVLALVKELGRDLVHNAAATAGVVRVVELNAVLVDGLVRARKDMRIKVDEVAQTVASEEAHRTTAAPAGRARVQAANVPE